MLGFLLAVLATFFAARSLLRTAKLKPRKRRKNIDWTDRITVGNIFAVPTLLVTLPVLWFYGQLAINVPMKPFSSSFAAYFENNHPVGSDEKSLISDLERRHFTTPKKVCRSKSTGVPHKYVQVCDGPVKYSTYATRLISPCGWQWGVSWTADENGKLVDVRPSSYTAEYFPCI